MKSTSAGALSSGCRRRGEGLRHLENPAGSALTLWMRVPGLWHGCDRGIPGGSAVKTLPAMQETRLKP